MRSLMRSSFVFFGGALPAIPVGATTSFLPFPRWAFADAVSFRYEGLAWRGQRVSESVRGRSQDHDFDVGDGVGVGFV